jgi:hypothetical protein
MAEPTYVSRSINYVQWIAAQLGDLEGFAAMAYELIQNADDSKASEIEFRVTDAGLQVTNDQAFSSCAAPFGQEPCPWKATDGDTSCDFHSFRSVAGGEKREKAETTGAFGIGFTSVYQVTDHPELISAGHHLILDESEVDERRMQLCGGCDREHDDAGTTVFLPWADSLTAMRQALRRAPMQQADRQRFIEDLTQAAPAALLFLRYLNKLVIDAPDGSRTVERQRVGNRTLLGDGKQTSEWLVLEGSFVQEADVLKVEHAGKIEDQRGAMVRVAVCADQGVAGGIHAGLPTTMTLQMPVRIDAEFFPSMNRKQIVLDEDHRSAWNRAALSAAARVLANSLTELLDLLGSQQLWELVRQAQLMLQDVEAGTLDRGFEQFWKALLATAPHAAIILRVDGSHDRANNCLFARDPATYREVQAISALRLPIVAESVARPLMHLPRTAIGLPDLTARHVVTAGKQLGFTDASAVREAPGEFARDSAASIRRLLEILLTSQVRSMQVEGLDELAVIPCLGDRLAAGHSAFLLPSANVPLFTGLDPELRVVDQAALEAESPSLVGYCRPWDVATVLTFLEQLPVEQLQERFKELLHWFRDHPTGLDPLEKQRLRALRIYPVGCGSASLDDAVLPGFVDPIDVATILRVDELTGLRDFLEDLGVRHLDVPTYLTEFAVPALQAGGLSDEERTKLLQAVVANRPELEQSPTVRTLLSQCSLAPTETGDWAAPSRTYFSDASLAGVGKVLKLRLGCGTSATADCLEWLGTGRRARAADLVVAAEEVSKTADSARSGKLFETLVQHPNAAAWLKSGDLAPLKRLPWLAVRGGGMASATGVHPVFNDYLFYTQGAILAAPRDLQNEAASKGIIDGLGIATRIPNPLIVRHLIACSSRGLEVHGEVYQRLSDAGVTDADLLPLRGVRCIQVTPGTYAFPHEVFWTEAPFGRHARRLDSSLRRYGRFFQLVGVKEEPDHTDCVRLLESLATEYRAEVLEQPEVLTVEACWRLLETSLLAHKVDAAWLHDNLATLPCIPNQAGLLERPDRLVFKDAIGTAERFPLLRDHMIIPVSDVWRAQTAAGVRHVADVVTTVIEGAENVTIDETVRDRITARERSINRAVIASAPETTSTGLAGLSALRYEETLSFRLRHTLEMFGRLMEAVDDSPPFYYDSRTQTLRRCSSAPIRWRVAARELARMLAPDNSSALAPALAVVLESDSELDAFQALTDLGTPLFELQSLEVQPVGIVESLGDTDIPDTQVSDDVDHIAEGDIGSVGDGSETAADIGSAAASDFAALARDGLLSADDQSDHDKQSDFEPMDDEETPSLAARTSGEARRTAGRSTAPPPQTGSSEASQQRMLSYVIPAKSEAARLGMDTSESPEVDRAGVDRVLEWEVAARRFPKEMDHSNPGFDVESRDIDGDLIRIIEVKSTAGVWGARGVLLSSRQMAENQERDTLFWLYVVEYARDDARYRITRIQNPAANIAYYGFDSNWTAIAE